MRSPDQLAAAFRASGRKVTPQRERIFGILYDNASHPTAEAVHAAVVADMPSVSLRTVYSVLHELADMGEVHQIQLGTGSTRFDTNVGEHHHLVCDRCGAVQDIDTEFPDVTVAERDRHGFVVDATQIVFRGRCERCADATNPHHNPDNKEQTPHG